MPILIFIIQRVILLFLAIMTFLGITSDETYLNASDNYRVEKERKTAILEILEKEDPIIIVEGRNDTLVERIGIDNILEKINEEFPVFGTKEPLPESFEEPENEVKEEFNTEVQKDTNILIDKIEEDLKRIRGEADKLAIEKKEESLPNTSNFVISNTAYNAVVNIVCLERINNSLSVITGSGIIISPKGTILTNGHVAQHLLNQKNENMDCEVKHPNNPSMNYRVTVLYIPNIWKGNKMLNLQHGTGENDYAFLSIVGPGPTGKIPDSFPYISPITSSGGIKVGNDILMLGYPSKNSGVYKIDTNLPLITDTSLITDVFTFNKISKDIFSSGVSPVAKQGSSGGAVVDEGRLLGLIVTTNAHESGGNILNAISLSYIKNDLADNGVSINTFIE